jgi:hypothetical protein
MSIKKLKTAFLICVLIYSACTNQRHAIIQPDPDFTGIKSEIPEFDEILATQDGAGAANLPDWLTRYLIGGIEEIERADSWQDKYVFIGRNNGTNFSALNQWAEGFTVYQDFPRLAAVRIESRLIAGAVMYPDDEYGEYFEALVKRAFDAEYPGAVKELTYWIKTKTEQENDPEEEDQIIEPLELYEFFVLISIDKTALQTQIVNLMAGLRTSTAPTRAQRTAIARVEEIFFEGF